MNDLRKAADEALAKLDLKILSQESLDNWYEKNITIEPCSPIDEEKWEEFAGYLQKSIYVQGTNTEEFSVLKTALYYYNDSPPAIVIEEGE
jgi:hypothetical protein